MRKSIVTVGLFSLLLVASALAGEAPNPVLSDDVRLSDLAPGSTIRFVLPLRVCSGETQAMHTGLDSDAVLDVAQFGGPRCKTLEPGTTIKFREAKFEISDRPMLTLVLGDSELRGISLFSPRTLTIKDLRRAMGGKIRVEGGVTRVSSGQSTDSPSVASGRDPKAVASAEAIAQGHAPRDSGTMVAL